MKLIIDIDEDTKNRLCFGITYQKDIQKVCEALNSGTPIPDNDCNNCEKAWTDKCERAECYKNNYKHWTPYQKGSKE